jgi:ABC-type Zn uptake system ZnuABC Zn-binding protein ZnuA
MKIVKVTYTVNPDFAAKNQQNVKEFVKDIEALNNPAIRYISYLGSDDKTFTHIFR